MGLKTLDFQRFQHMALFIFAILPVQTRPVRNNVRPDQAGEENSMNENQTNQEATETTDSFMEGWDEPETGELGGTGGETTPEQEPESQISETRQENAENPAGNQGAEGNQPQPETAGGEGGTEGAQQQAQQPTADAPKMWTLRHLDEVRQVGEADMVALAQKGLDYDRIRGKYDESKPVMELFGTFARQAGMSVSDYVSQLRTRAKQASGMSEAEAKRAVDLENREAAVSAKEAEEAQRQSTANQAAQAKAAADARRSADIAEFQKLFPDAAKDPKAIPPEVWVNVRSGMTLVSAYSKYAVDQANAARQAAEQKAAATEQNRKNAARATGSMQSAGENTGGKDPFLEGWDS